MGRLPRSGNALTLCLVALFASSAANAMAAKSAASDQKPEAPAAVEKVKWGEADGKEVDLYTLQNKNGLVAKVTNYGAILVELRTPDRDGKLGDIVVGYDNLAD